MARLLAERAEYTRAEYLSDLAVHMAGLLAASAGVPALIALAALPGQETGQTTGAAVYGLSLAAMIACSAAYNVFDHPGRAWLLKRLDHAAIHLKIAGTVTGLALIAGKGLAPVSGVWAVAALGIALKLHSPFRYRAAGLALYLGLGGLAALSAASLFPTLPPFSVTLICAGLLIYLVGFGFYLASALRFHYTIWHACVLAASLMVYAGVLGAVL